MKKIIVLYLGKKGSAPCNAYSISEAFLKNNIHLDCFLSNRIENKSKWDELNMKNNISIHYVNTYNSKIGFLFKSLNFLKMKKIAKEIIDINADFIYIPMISLWSALISRFLPKDLLVTTIHDFNPHLGSENFIIDYLKDYNAKISKRIIVHSKKFKSMVSKKYSLSEENILYTPLGNYVYYNNNFIPDDKVFYKVLFFGRITKYKGLGILLKALTILRKRGVTLNVRIVGSGKLTDEEITLVAELGDSVELINEWIDENKISDYFHGVDVTVLPYIEASQSGVVMTSYSFYKPVVVTDVGGLSEQVYTDTGMCIEPNNSELLASTLESLYKEPKKLLKMGMNAYMKATQELTWDNTALDILNFLYGR